ncbi:hypothetical protein OENI_10274 [Oenococcus oeni]|nr:hypothetical protein OENI_10274 [Oenococcus oeni]
MIIYHQELQDYKNMTLNHLIISFNKIHNKLYITRSPGLDQKNYSKNQSVNDQLKEIGTWIFAKNNPR